MWKQMVLGLGLALAVSTGAFADDQTQPAPASNAAPAVTDSHLAAAVDLLEAQNAKSNMKSMFNSLMSAVGSSVRQSHPGVSEDKFKLFTEAFSEELENSIDDLLKMQAKVYAEHFSENELRALAAFYRSDLGKKYISEIPLILKETVPLGVAWGQEVGPKAAERAMERLKKKGVEL